MSEWIRRLAERYSEVNEKKKMDAVGQEDGDIDNDGDKDSSDEYLMKRRKAIGKAMKNEEKVECPKCKGEGCDHCEGKGYHMKEAYESVAKEMKKMHDEGYSKKQIMAKYNHMDQAQLEKLYASSCGGMREEVDESTKAALAKKLAKASAPSEKGKKAVTLKKAPWEKNEANNDEEVIMNPKKEKKDKETGTDTMAQESTLPPVYARIMENRAKQYGKAAAPEDWNEKEKNNKGANDMKADHKGPTIDNPEAGDQMTKAANAAPNGATRKGDNKAGDKKIIPSATPTKGM